MVEHFPDLSDVFEGAQPSLVLNISVFDHWLTTDEADTSDVLSFDISRARNATDRYLLGEQKFLRLYSLLSSGGVICNRPRPLRKFDGLDEELRSIVVESLREQSFMDLYFVAYNTRVVGRYDRTDIAIANPATDLEGLRDAVIKCGLHILV